MKRKRVSEIVLPYKEEVPLEPSVTMDDKIVGAIELMVTRNVRCVAVVSNGMPVGMVKLEDAFAKLGLRSWRGKPAGTGVKVDT
jgi:CBS domain-containing protein